MTSKHEPIHLKVAPKGMGINDFVALEEGYFRDEGIDFELRRSG